MKPPALLAEQLVERARQLAIERGWSWHEPVEIKAGACHGESAWEIRSNALMLGQNVRVVFRRSDLELLDAAYLPR